MSYYQQKALIAKSLYEKGLPWIKVYATVRDGENFIVLTGEKNGKTEYMLPGGGVDEGETLEEAIKREVLEELNIEVEVIGELGIYDKLIVPWKYEGQTYNIQYEIHVMDTRLIKRNDGNLGLEGEFNQNVKMAVIDKTTLLENVVEFNSFGINLD